MRTPVRRLLYLAVALGLMSIASVSEGLAGVLETVRARDHLLCGVGDGPKGYSTVNGAGVWSGISVDFCRALATAVLGNKEAVKFRPIYKSERFSTLQAGEVHALFRGDAMTPSRAPGLGRRFPTVAGFTQ